MDRIKKYIDCAIPTQACNLRCHYCYITHNGQFGNKIPPLNYSIETIGKAFSVNRLGGICLINLCAAGETLLPNYVLDIVLELLKQGHFVMIVTNGVLTKRFVEISKWPKEYLTRLFFKFSFHYLELKRLNLLDQYTKNVQLMKDSGASFTVELTPSDELIPYIDEIKQECINRFGALCHVTIARDERTEEFKVLSDYSYEEYQKIWRAFDSKLFDYKTSIFYKKRKEFCYAGNWSLTVNLLNGIYKQCNYEKMLGNIYENLDKPLYLEAVGHKCSMPHCYNGHSFLVFGDIPELEAPTYTELRNRVCEDGSEWLCPRMKEFFSRKLYEDNKEYNSIKKFENDVKPYVDKSKQQIKGSIKQISAKLKK